MAVVPIAFVDGIGEVSILLRMGGVVVVETHPELGKIGLVLLGHPGNQRLRLYTLLTGAQHDRRAVGVVGADIQALFAAHLLETDPDIGLDILHQVTDMDRSIGIG